jgi:hypothetical protein
MSESAYESPYELGMWAFGARSFVNPFDYHEDHGMWAAWEDGYNEARKQEHDAAKAAELELPL